MALSASEQLTAESAMTQSGDIAGAVKSSQVYTTGSPALDPDTPSVVTSQEAEDATTQNQSDLQAQIDSMQQAAEDSAASQTTSTSTSTTDTSTSDYNAEMQSISDALQAQYDSYAGQLDTFATSLNEANQAYIEAIKASYARRMEQMETLNKSTYASQQLLGVRSGRQRYASEIHTSILSAEEAAGIQRLTDLETEMNQIVAEAEMANTAKQFELLDKKMSQFQALQDQKLSIIQNMQSTALQQEQLLLQKAQDAREQARFDREEKAATIDSITSAVFSSLTGDEETDAKTIQSLAKQYGVDPNALLGSVKDYDLQFQQNAMDVAAKYQSIAQTIPEGASWTDPTTGMTFYGTKDPENVDVTQTVGNTEFKVRYKMVDGELQEQWRIELGPRWQPGTGGSSTSTDASTAMNETIAYLQGLGLSEEEMASEIEWAAEQLSVEYGTDSAITADTIASRLSALSMSDEEVEQALDSGRKGIFRGLGSYLSSGEFFRPGGFGLGGLVSGVGNVGAEFLEGATGTTLGK